MIKLCERCYAPVEDDVNVVVLAHIDHALPDGSIAWTHTHLHTSGCVAPCLPAHQRPNTGAWDSGRGIGAFRS